VVSGELVSVGAAGAFGCGFGYGFGQKASLLLEVDIIGITDNNLVSSDFLEANRQRLRERGRDLWWHHGAKTLATELTKVGINPASPTGCQGYETEFRIGDLEKALDSGIH